MLTTVVTAAKARWWADMLTVQVLVRVVVLVADAPRHDFHHRGPSSPHWTEYVHARRDDLDAGCPGYPLNYGETWGLFGAIDENLVVLSRAGAEIVPGLRSRPIAGHTPGHTGYEVSSNGQSLLIVGDAVHVAQVQFERPDIGVVFDGDGAAADKSRAALFEEAARTGS